MDYDYDDFKGRGSVLTWYKELQFEMEVNKFNNSILELKYAKLCFQIRRNHTTNEISSEIRLYNPGNQNDYVVKVHPNNGYTQLTAREVKITFPSRLPVTHCCRLD